VDTTTIVTSGEVLATTVIRRAARLFTAVSGMVEEEEIALETPGTEIARETVETLTGGAEEKIEGRYCSRFWAVSWI
jgi:hypothetical protein